jgi:hypothetical protein
MSDNITVSSTIATAPTRSFQASRGQIVGASLGVCLSLLAYDIVTWKFAPQVDDDLVILWGAFSGEIIGRVIELRRQERWAEIVQFASRQLTMVPLFALMTIAALVGDHFFGNLGRYFGLIGVPLALAAFDWSWRRVWARQT